MPQITQDSNLTKETITAPESPVDPRLRLFTRLSSSSENEDTSDTCSASQEPDSPEEIFQAVSSRRRRELQHRREGIVDLTKLFEKGAEIYDAAEEEENRSRAYYEAHKSEDRDWGGTKSDEEVDRQRGIDSYRRFTGRSTEEGKEEQDEGEISVLLVQGDKVQGLRVDSMFPGHEITSTEYASSEGTVFEDD